MDREEEEEVWTVVINAGGRTISHRLSCNATIGEAIEIWERRHSRRRGSRAKSLSGEILSSYQRLRDVGELTSSSKVVAVEIDEAICLKVRIYGASGPSDNREIDCILSEKPEELHMKVRVALRIPGDRRFRLRDGSGPLNDSLDLRQQNVTNETLLLVDLTFDVAVVDSWDDTVHYRNAFASEKVGDIIAATELPPGRVLAGQLQLDAEKELADAFPATATSRSEVWIVHQSQRTITAVINNSARQLHVWPRDTIEKVWPKRLPLSSNLMCEGQPVSALTAFKDMGVMDDGIIYCAASASVPRGDGRWRVVRVDGDAAATAGRLGDPEGLDGDSDIQAAENRESREKMLVVTVGNRSVRWSMKTEALRRTEVIGELAARGGISLTELKDCNLRCEGCGRTLTQAEEAKQQIPANCCSKQSLHLRVSKQTDSGTQAEIWLNQQPSSTEDSGHRPGLKDESCQTSSALQPRTRSNADAEVQTDWETAEVGCQHERPSTSSKRFHIINRYPDLRTGQDFVVSVPLSDDPCVGELRSELALVLNLNADRMKLKREIGVCHGREVFEVAGGWADGEGNKFRISDPEVKEKRLKRFDNEMERFPILRRDKNVIRISRRYRRESFPLSFK